MTKSDMKPGQESSIADKTSRATGEIRETASDMAETGKQMLSDAKSKVSEAVSGVAEKAGERLDSTKNRLADQGERVAESLREVAGRDEEGGMQSRVLESVATGLNSVTDTLRSADPSAMISSVQRFAQRNPILFATGAAVAGLLVARALAGASSSQSSYSGRDYGRTEGRNYSRDQSSGSMGYESGLSENMHETQP